MVVCGDFIFQFIGKVIFRFLQFYNAAFVVVLSNPYFIAIYSPLKNRDLETNRNSLAVARLSVCFRKTIGILVQSVTDYYISIKTVV